MDSSSSLLPKMPKPERLLTLVSNLKFSKGNTILHQFVLDNSDPNHSGSASYINAVLLSMSEVPVNELNDDGYCALRLAVWKNNLLMVEKLLSCLLNIDVNARVQRERGILRYSRNILEFGETPLHLAARLGHSSIIRELLKKGAGIDMTTVYHGSALCIAVKSGHLDAMRVLISEGANVNLNTGTALSNAINLRNLAAVEILVRSGAVINFKDFQKSLFLAVLSENLAITKFLVSNGAHVNKRTLNEMTLLHRAASSNLEIVRYLVSIGADINTKKENGIVPLHNAVRGKKLEIAAFLLDRGADINAKDRGDVTPLHYAVDYGELKCVKLLTDREADVNAKNRLGETPLHYAVNEGRLACMKYLIDHGADINSKNHLHETPLHCAVMKRNWEIYLFLKYSEVWTHRDVLSPGDSKIVKLLIDQGADLSSIDEEGKTPLHDKVYEEDFKMVRVLSEQGDLRSAERGWFSRKHDTQYLFRAKVIRTLLHKGADLTAKNENGETPLDLARNQTCLDMLQSYMKDMTPMSTT